MKIIQIKWKEVELKFREPLLIADRTWQTRSVYFLSIKTDTGITGYGESAPLPEWGTETHDVFREIIPLVALEFKNKFLPKTLTKILNLLDNFNIDLQKYPALRYGIESAILDIFSKTQGKTLSELICNNPDSSFLMSALIGTQPKAVTLAQIGQLYNQSYRTFKIKCGSSISETLELVGEINSRFADADIRLDPNGKWKLEDAVKFVQNAEKLKIEYIEQPFPKECFDDLLKLAKSSTIPIALDESIGSIDESKAMQKHPQFVQIIKPMTFGSIIQTAEHISSLIEGGVKAILSSALDSGLACATYFAIANSLNSDEAHGLGTVAILEDALVNESPMIVYGLGKTTGLRIQPNQQLREALR
jgi:o-succinylbenzoate synthase